MVVLVGWEITVAVVVGGKEELEGIGGAVDLGSGCRAEMAERCTKGM